VTPKTLGPVRDGVGESPFWDAQEQAVWSVDITGKCIRKRSWPDGETTSWDTEDLPTALALHSEGGAVVSFARGVSLWSKDGTLSIVCPEADPQMRLNEGKCDPRGRFWVASMENNLTTDLRPRSQDSACGRLFRIDGATATACSEAEFGIPNTMAWSPDRTRFFLADSLQNTIWVWDYDDVTGAIENRRIHVSGGPGLPDGSCMDSEGCLWTARFAGGRVIRYDPDGRVEREIMLPVENPTSATFAGADLSTLVVTSASFGMTEPGQDDGAMLVVQTDIRGQNENWFAG